MKCAAMQPCYLPWLGHLRLISYVDHFVFLDDAQYSKNGWDNRNRILLTNKSIAWITVPVSHSGLGTPLDSVCINVDTRWRRKHVQTLRQSYGRHHHFEDLCDIIEVIEYGNQEFLADLNYDLLQVSIKNCKLRAKIHRSRAMCVGGKRSERLERLCDILGCDTYISTPGARRYLESDLFGVAKGLELQFMSIEFAQYLQRNSESFVPQLSFVDALANTGWEGLRNLIR